MLLITGACAQSRAIRVMNIPVIGIFPCGGITDSHRDGRGFVQRIIEIVASIRTAGHIGGVQALAAILIMGSFGAGVYDAVVLSIAIVIHRG